MLPKKICAPVSFTSSWSSLYRAVSTHGHKRRVCTVPRTKSIDHDGHYRFLFSSNFNFTKPLMSEKQSDHFTHLIARTYAISRSIIQPLLPSTRLFAERSRFRRKGLHLFWLPPALVFVIPCHPKQPRQVIRDDYALVVWLRINIASP